MRDEDLKFLMERYGLSTKNQAYHLIKFSQDLHSAVLELRLPPLDLTNEQIHDLLNIVMGDKE